MVSLTLDRTELKALTGAAWPSRMVQWLTDHGWVFEIPRGRGALPAVDRQYYLDRMSGRLLTTRKTRLKLDRM